MAGGDQTREDGKPRTGQDVILIGLRSFYYDLHTWAAVLDLGTRSA
ncbi:hypothetical protein [Nocardia amikacinitolerans]|nr:hypothetical protein [Nocardia amikacinitolerans]